MSEESIDVPDKLVKREEKGIPTMYTPVPEDMVSELRARKLIRLMTVGGYFMGSQVQEFECPADEKVRTVLKTMLAEVQMMVRNRFSFYVYISPFDVIWHHEHCQPMAKPVKSDVFRQLIIPSQGEMCIGELMEGADHLNVYIFVKRMNDVFNGTSKRSWRLEHVFGREL